MWRLRRLFGNKYGLRNEIKSQPVKIRVLTIIYNPKIPSKKYIPLISAMRWNNIDELIIRYIEDIRECSDNYARFEEVERIEVNTFPEKEDGFFYTGDDYIRHISHKIGFHKPDTLNYHRVLDDFDIINKINSRIVDEIWLFGPPYGGFYESRMAGQGAFWCNAPPMRGTDHAMRRFIIMGFNYERGVGEMLENFCHRAESIMHVVYQNLFGSDNLWERFIRHQESDPGKAEVGSVHYAPNSLHDYDWGNTRTVLCRSHTWYKYPDLSGKPRLVNCREWGGGDIRLHHKWWLKHFPHSIGKNNQISNNWWEYVINPNKI